MSLPIPSDLWQELCALQARYPTCIVTLYKHEQTIGKIDVLITLKAGQCERSGTGSDVVPYGVSTPQP